MNIYETIDRLIDASTINEISSFAPVEFDDAKNVNESEALTDYVTSDLGAKENNDVVKIVAAAMQMASESGELETPSSSPLQTAITAVNITQNLNLSYLLEKGQIMAEEATDVIIDQATVSASVVAEVALSPQCLEMGLDVSLDYVSVQFPPAMPVAQFAKQFTPQIASYISNKVKPVIKKGIQKVSQIVKEVSHRVITKVSSTVKSTVKKVFNKVLSWF